MNVVFIHRGGPGMASYRYRALIPAQQLSHINGYQCSINGGDADIAVFSKPVPEDMEIFERAKSEKVRIVVDLGDDHFHHKILGPLYRTMAERADVLVVPTEEMKKRVFENSARESMVIPDPYEEPECEPHAVGMNALWFGHKVNLPPLMPWISIIKKNGFDLRIVTGPNPPPDCVAWSPKTVKEELARANVVVLPTKPGDEYKSPNRLLNTIRAGCFAVCDPHPSYEEFKHFMWVGDIRTGLHWCKAFSEDLNRLVKRAQEHIEERYSPATIAHKWAQLLEAL